MRRFKSLGLILVCCLVSCQVHSNRYDSEAQLRTDSSVEPLPLIEGLNVEKCRAENVELFNAKKKRFAELEVNTESLGLESPEDLLAHDLEVMDRIASKNSECNGFWAFGLKNRIEAFWCSVELQVLDLLKQDGGKKDAEWLLGDAEGIFTRLLCNSTDEFIGESLKKLLLAKRHAASKRYRGL